MLRVTFMHLSFCSSNSKSSKSYRSVEGMLFYVLSNYQASHSCQSKVVGHGQIWMRIERVTMVGRLYMPDWRSKCAW